jgi:hypothetical protein
LCVWVSCCGFGCGVLIRDHRTAATAAMTTRAQLHDLESRQQVATHASAG